MSSSSNQFRHVLRRLLHSPMFTGMTLLTLAIGIGANTAIFSVIDGVLLKPLPYPHPEQLVGLWHRMAGLDNQVWNMSASCYFVYREQNRTFQDVGLYTADQLSITDGQEPVRVP